MFHDFSIILHMFMLPKLIFQGRLTEADLAETTALFGGHSGNQGPVAWRKAVDSFRPWEMDLAETTKGGIFMEYSWNIGVLMGYYIYIQYTVYNMVYVWYIWYMYGIYGILMG